MFTTGAVENGCGIHRITEATEPSSMEPHREELAGALLLGSIADIDPADDGRRRSAVPVCFPVVTKADLQTASVIRNSVGVCGAADRSWRVKARMCSRWRGCRHLAARQSSPVGAMVREAFAAWRLTRRVQLTARVRLSGCWHCRPPAAISQGGQRPPARAGCRGSAHHSRRGPGRRRRGGGRALR
jgi:hypothetical protein